MAKTNSDASNGTAFAKDWTQGPIVANLLKLSWPMVLMETLYVLSQVIDMIWVGRLGPAAIAGVGIANLVLVLVMSMDIGLVMGVRAMISRFIGAGDRNGANHVAGQAFLLAICWGLIVMVGGSLSCYAIMNLFGVESEVITQGTAYLKVMFAGWVPLIVLVMGLYTLQSSGDTVTPLKIEILIRVVHILLCPFLVLGWWWAPRMGACGAALSNVIAHILGMVIVLVLFFQGRSRLKLTLGAFRPDVITIRRILKIGVPAVIMSVQRAFGNLVLTRLIAPFGTMAVAAHSLVARVELFLLLPGSGLGMGAGVLVGQNLGAGHPRRAERSAWTATAFLESIMVVCSLAILFWAGPIIALFTDDPALQSLGVLFLRIASAGYATIAFVTVLQSCITGAGDTVPTMIINVLLIWVIQLPLAYFLAWYTPMGVFGLRWAMVIYTCLGALAFILYFRSGRWKNKKV